MFERSLTTRAKPLPRVPRSPRIRLGAFCLDAAEHQLLRDGAAVPLTHKAMAVLAHLVSKPGALCTKAELFGSVWAGRVVTDSALSQVIHELRTALEDGRASPRYIATVHGFGFRFVGPVCVDTDADAARAGEARLSSVAARTVTRAVGRGPDDSRRR